MMMGYAEVQGRVSVGPADGASVAGRLVQLDGIGERLTKLAGMAEAVADRLSGTNPPTPDAPRAPSAVPNGLGETLGMVIDSLNGRLDRTERHLERALKALG
jgi:hypothetical protein